MGVLHTLWLTFLETLAPRSPCDRRYDVLETHTLARVATRTMVHGTPPCLAPLPYDHTLIRDAVHAAKYRGHARAAALLGEVLAPFIAEELAERRSFGTYTTPLLIPIPLHLSRLRERGFNQAERIACAVRTAMGDRTITLNTTALVRTRDTGTQTHQIGRVARARNIRGAFSVAKPERVTQADIVLLDDVYTTGATMRAACGALRAAGARSILCVAAAH